MSEHDEVSESVDCREVVTFLWAYLADELPPEKAAAFERHLTGCDACVSYLETYKSTIELTKGALAEPAAEEIPEDLVRAVLAARQRQE